MNPTIAQIQQQLQALQAQVSANDTILKHHRHTGYDSSQTLFSISTIYGGAVNSSGSAEITLPRGWTCQRNSAGIYQVNHQLATKDYGVVVTPRDLPAAADTVTFTVSTTEANYFIVQFVNPSTTAAINTAFSFMTVRNQ